MKVNLKLNRKNIYNLNIMLLKKRIENPIMPKQNLKPLLLDQFVAFSILRGSQLAANRYRPAQDVVMS